MEMERKRFVASDLAKEVLWGVDWTEDRLFRYECWSVVMMYCWTCRVQWVQLGLNEEDKTWNECRSVNECI